MYDFDRIVKAAEFCEFHNAFASDIKLCENALGMGGLMGINAECWLDILNTMPDAEIAEYVHTKYKPGLLNPFKGTSLYIKSQPLAACPSQGERLFLFDFICDSPIIKVRTYERSMSSMLKKLKFLIFCAFVVCAAMPATVYAESFTTQNAAVETITQHTLTFNPNCTDDSYFISESSINIPESHKYGTLPVPSRKGYEFLGWYTASDGGNKVSESTVMGSSDTIVYAHWTAYTITINYHNDGAQTWHSYCANAVNSCTNLDIVESESTAYDTAYTHAEYGILDVGRFTKARYKASNRWKVGSKDSSVMVVDTNWSEELAASATGKTVAKYLGVDAQLEQSNVTVDLYPYFIEDSYNSVVNGVTPASTTVEAYVPTLYSLIVPESVTLGGNAGSGEKTATLPVMVKGDIGLSQEVNVSTTPPTMKSNKAADVLASVETPKAVWNRDDALASITSNYTVKANLTPGDWSGTVSFVCSVSEN